ncbi:MAG: UDP-N-acetylmuramoyl-tripeptide--D-alanyl-D-alanine ligase [Limnochordaceae bacterium]|nr:UDP-N-acetylmuramoyl-tripeptide--D-alanyl-D-alanine ligase [Limnochordaceae bacterium]
MESLRVDEIAAAVGGRLDPACTPDRQVQGVAVDSRAVAPGDLFVALPGERTDGHRFVLPAWQAGAAALLVSQAKEAEIPASVRSGVVWVDDPLAALLRLGRWYRERFPVQTVAVTGSNGKTTTKEMIAAILRQVAPTLRSAGNFNTEIGLPLTLFQLSREHRYLVVEMGMRGPGQIRRLAGLAKPQAGVVTNVGPVHLELLGSLEAIRRAKQELVESLLPGGVAVLNADDPRVSSMAPAASGARVVFYGFSSGAEARAVDVDLNDVTRCRYTLVWQERVRIPIEVPVPGRAAVWNSLAAACLALAWGVDPGKIQAGLAHVEPTARRLQVVNLPGEVTLIEDMYNASPASFAVALDVLSRLGERRAGSRRVAVVGDMRELGEYAPQAHRQLGEELVHAGVELLVTVGPWAQMAGESAQASAGQKGQPLEWHATADSTQAASVVAPLLRAGDIVLIKGSRALELERVAEVLHSH